MRPLRWYKQATLINLLRSSDSTSICSHQVLTYGNKWSTLLDIVLLNIKDNTTETKLIIRNVYKIRRSYKKTSTDLFRVDLKPSIKNKAIYKLRTLVSLDMTIETPMKPLVWPSAIDVSTAAILRLITYKTMRKVQSKSVDKGLQVKSL